MFRIEFVTPCLPLLGGFLLMVIAAPCGAAGSEIASTPTIAQRSFGAETIQVPPFELPPSEFLTRQTLTELRLWAKAVDDAVKRCPEMGRAVATSQDILVLRRCMDESYLPSLVAKQRRNFTVTIQARDIAGVPTEVISPVEHIVAHRVLINLHGGSFQVMGGLGGEIESIPIAAVSGIKVISVNYRMAPEFAFPAASEDVAAVYKALLSEYRAESIGIYGCSAGGMLAAESVAWLQKEKLPLPGAIAMLSGGAYWADSADSQRIAAAIMGPIPEPASTDPPPSYFKPADFKNPLAFPGNDPAVMARFPPSLLISATRDVRLSQVLMTHSELVSLGVKADLHVWEGLGHCFVFDPDLKESQDAYAVISQFFAHNLRR